MTNRLSSARHGLGLAAFLAAALASGCGNLTMGGLGNATVVVSGDAPDAAQLRATPAPPRGSVGGSSTPARSAHDDEPEGEIEVEFRLYLVSETGSPTQLGEDDIEVRIDLAGDTEFDAVDEPVPVARYTHLQVVFTEIQAEVDAGLVIDGVPVLGEIRVDFDDLTLSVTKPLDVDVSAGTSVELLLDLNTPAWLQAVDPVQKTVDASVFADLMAVVVR